MRVYIATALERAADHNRVRDVLVARGHAITYDWTAHGSVKDEGEARIAEVAALEAAGVRAADVVVVLLPGGRGTHAELGMAIALGKPIVVVGVPTGRFFEVGAPTCAFYYAPTVRRIYISGWQDPAEIRFVALAAERAAEGR